MKSVKLGETLEPDKHASLAVLQKHSSCSNIGVPSY